MTNRHVASKAQALPENYTPAAVQGWIPVHRPERAGEGYWMAQDPCNERLVTQMVKRMTPSLHWYVTTEPVFNVYT